MPRGVPIDQSPHGPLWDRLAALLFVSAGAAMVFLLARVTPDPRGLGTHEQLGLAPCGWAASYGSPCPTCGITTAASHLVHLSPLRAVEVQPFGAVLAAAGIFAAGYAAFCLLTRRSFLDALVRLPFGTLLVSGIVLFFGSWAYKHLTFAT